MKTDRVHLILTLREQSEEILAADAHLQDVLTHTRTPREFSGQLTDALIDQMRPGDALRLRNGGRMRLLEKDDSQHQATWRDDPLTVSA